MFYKMGRIQFLIPKKLRDIIYEYVDRFNVKSGDKLLGVNTEATLSLRIKKIFNKYTNDNGFSSQILRHSFSSFIYNRVPRLNRNEWSHIAKLMGHSLVQNMGYNKIINDNKMEKNDEIEDDLCEMLKIKIF